MTLTTEQLKRGFEVVEEDDHIIRLDFRGLEVTCFSTSGGTIESIRREADRARAIYQMGFDAGYEAQRYDYKGKEAS